MYFCRRGSWFAIAFLIAGWALTTQGGCSQEEQLEPDPGASPFYPAPADPKAASNQGDKAKAAGIGQAGVASAAPDQRDKGSSGSDELDTRFGTNDIERQVRKALRTARNGDPETAAKMLDQVLAVEPIHREALTRRAALALEQSQKAKSPDERAAALGKAADLVRSLFRAYEAPKENEKELFGRILYNQVRMMTEKGRFDEVVPLLKEASDADFNVFSKIESDDVFAALRASPQFKAALSADDESKLARARERTKGRLKPPGDRFQFTLPDLSGKKVSLGDFKGKVVVVDFWGTWCAPCRDSIPHLIEMHNNWHRRGLEIVGLSYEKDAPSESEARELVKKVVKAARIPYTCLMGDESTVSQVPGFVGFPTTVLVDRAGKARLFITKNDEHTLELIRDAVRVLLAEPVAGGNTKSKPEKAANG
jgi:thiol-disulfide isomerase/thioredoxin